MFVTKVIANLGLCISIYDINEIQGGCIYPGEGASTHTVYPNCNISFSHMYLCICIFKSHFGIYISFQISYGATWNSNVLAILCVVILAYVYLLPDVIEHPLLLDPSF